MFEFIINGLVLVSLVVAAYCLYGYAKESKLKFPWWKWVLSIGWFLAMLLVFGFIGTAVGEGSPGAALRGGIAFGLLLLVSGVIVFFICFPHVWRGLRKKTGTKAMKEALK